MEEGGSITVANGHRKKLDGPVLSIATILHGNTIKIGVAQANTVAHVKVLLNADVQIPPERHGGCGVCYGNIRKVDLSLKFRHFYCTFFFTFRTFN